MNASPFAGVVAPLYRHHLDTDTIIPSFRIQDTHKKNLSAALFGGLRYMGEGLEPQPDFILNRPPYDQATFLVGGNNFGCGSSREAAVWALQAFGFRCVIAPSFGATFYRNCIYNGLIPARVKAEMIEAHLLSEAPIELTLDLAAAHLYLPAQLVVFEISTFYQQLLIEQTSILDISQGFEKDVKQYENKRK